ncbi:MAG: FAD-dependent oxidoreductase [Clostridium sp.]|nr:FAD-dependent oxidoreductase [Bacteroides sp.]MCM1197568.1 FAD-dependent oxidoreductase [Clostridium sp.]
MIRILFSLLALVVSLDFCPAYEYDLVVVGGTPGGITAAIAVARQGNSVLILERTAHIGGLPANGLGATDITTRGATTGLFIDFVERNRTHYLETYGPDSQQLRDCSGGYHFEPSVAEQTFLSMIAEYSGKIKVMYGRQFDSDPANVEMNGHEVRSILVTDRATGKDERYAAKIFIDATYEGDLAAAANIPYRLGRESRVEFGEPCAGRIYRHWGVQFNKGIKAVHNGYDGYESDGTTYQGDNAVQAYNYRLCLTDDKTAMVPVKKPHSYDREEFASIVEDVLTGRNTGVEMLNVTPEDMEDNRRHILAGGITGIPGDPWGISKVTNMVVLPNSKTDANNQHMAFVSTDLPEENWPWPTSSWEWRDRFAQRLKDYTLGLLWFVQNDKALPEHFRRECRRWGLSSDEYKDNDNFPRQVYVREGRRMAGTYVFTANDAIPVGAGQRPPVHKASITASHYALDSHAVRKREEGKAHLDGFFGYESKPYTVPLGVMIPEHVTNLLFPVPVSGTHIGFSTMRMEPCWMALGEAAGTAAVQAIDCGLPVQCLNVDALQKELVRHKATLIYFYDIDTSSESFEMVQLMGVKGYLPGWEADLDGEISKETRADWKKLSGVEIPSEIIYRGEALKFIYSKIK